MTDYTAFAAHYDRLTDNVGYPWRAARLEALAKKFLRTDTEGTLLVDLACGTGNFSEAMAERGFDVIGVDLSPAMLSVAEEKKLQSGLDIQYICQDIRELDMYGTIDVFLCMLDGLNHLPSLADVEKVFARVSLFLQPGGVFLFDMNTPYKHRCVLENRVFLYDLPDLFCAWENRLMPDEATVNMHLTFFAREGETYTREEETLRETAYPAKTIEAVLQRAGLTLLGVYDADAAPDTPARCCPVTETTERYLFAAGKPCVKEE